MKPQDFALSAWSLDACIHTACFSYDGKLQTALSVAASGGNDIDMDRPLHFRGVCPYLIVAGELRQPIGDFGLVAY